MHHNDMTMKLCVLWPDVEFGVAGGGRGGRVIYHTLEERGKNSRVVCFWRHIKQAEIADILENLNHCYISYP